MTTEDEKLIAELRGPLPRIGGSIIDAPEIEARCARAADRLASLTRASGEALEVAAGKLAGLSHHSLWLDVVGYPADYSQHQALAYRMVDLCAGRLRWLAKHPEALSGAPASASAPAEAIPDEAVEAASDAFVLAEGYPSVGPKLRGVIMDRARVMIAAALPYLRPAAPVVEPSDEAGGAISWHATEEGGLPDVGVEINLGDDRTLWLGEMPDSAIEEAEVYGLGSTRGFWIVLYENRKPGSRRILGKLASHLDADEIGRAIGAAVRAQAKLSQNPASFDAEKWDTPASPAPDVLADAVENPSEDLVEDMAKAIHDTDCMADSVWPSSEDDDGHRGGDGYVRLCPHPEIYRAAAINALAAIRARASKEG